MKTIFELLLLAVIVIILIYLFFSFAQTLFAPVSDNVKYGSVCFKNKCFQVELAETKMQREKGLMNRQVLGDNNGMLFIFEKDDIYPFWMKNTLIPLDIIWIDSNGVVVFIEENVEPCVDNCSIFKSDREAKYVLEIRSKI